MASANKRLDISGKESRHWRKYNITGDAQYFPKLMEGLADLILESATIPSFVIKINPHQTLSLDLQFNNSDETRFVNKYKILSDHFKIVNSDSSTFPHDALLLDKEVRSNQTVEIFQLSIQTSTEHFKFPLARTIINYISIFSFSRSNILTLGLYLHFSILNGISSIVGENQMKNGLLVDNYLKEGQQMCFSPEFEYVTNKESIDTITKHVFTGKVKKATKWLNPFKIALQELLEYNPGEIKSYDALIIECKIREQINCTLGLSSREIHTLYYFISREICDQHIT